MYIDIELLLIIIGKSPHIWKYLLSLPRFGRWTLTEEGKQKSRELFETKYVGIWGSFRTENWRIAGLFHRKDGPAHIAGDINNWINEKENMPGTRREWWINGKRHREGGPAIEIDCVFHDNDGTTRNIPIYDEWYLNGKNTEITDRLLNITNIGNFKKMNGGTMENYRKQWDLEQTIIGIAV